MLFSIAVFTFGIGIFVYFNDRSSRTNVAFFLVTLVAGLWALSIVMFLEARGAPSAVFWSRIIYVCAVCFPACFLFFSHVFPHKKIILPKLYRIFYFTPVSIFCAFLFFSDLWIKGVMINKGSNSIVLGSVYPVWAVWFGVYIIWASWILLKKYKLSSGIQRAQLSYVLAALILPAFGSLPTNVVLPYFGVFRFIWIGPIFITTMLGAVSYAIVRHRLMDIRVAIRRGAVFTSLFAIVAIIFVSSTSILLRFLPDILANLLSALIVTLFFVPLKTILENITDKVFFRGQYNASKLLAKLNRIIVETIDLDTLTHDVLKLLMDEMRIGKAAFMMMDMHNITDIKGQGYQNVVLPSKLEALFHEFHPLSMAVSDELENNEVKSLFRSAGISVAVPIKVEEVEVAILILGSKLSGDLFYKKDLDILEIFASEAGVAIQNAKAYAAIKKFNQDLEQKVEERTKELKLAQERELAKAKEVAKLKDEFVFIAAHELRTPITAIRGFLELVSEAGAKFPKDVKAHLDSIGAASSQLNQLVEDLLEIARSEAGTMKVDLGPVDISELIESEIKVLFPLISAKHLLVNFNNKTNLPVVGDAMKLKEVISNLFSNAIKYNKSGGTIDITLIQERPIMIVEFRDTGFGIPKEQQDKIFQKFFRARDRKTADILGTGLGLFLTRILVEKMGGKIMFSSVEGEGSTFSFSLPLAVK